MDAVTDIIERAVRAGCGPRCTYPDCICAYTENAAYVARHAASAMRERAAQVAAHGMKWAEPEQVAAAIRAIPTEGEPKS